MDFFYAIVGFHHPAIDSVIDSVLAHVQNDLRHAQQIIDSAGKYTCFFLTETMANFNGFHSLLSGI
jgi:hypothetical protein